MLHGLLTLRKFPLYSQPQVCLFMHHTKTCLCSILVHRRSTMPEKKVFLFGPPLFGHIIPLLELARRLADKHLDITFITSYSKIAEITIRKLLPASYSNKIRFVGLHDGNDEDYEQASPTDQHFFDIAYRMDAAIHRSVSSPSFYPDNSDNSGNLNIQWQFAGAEESCQIVVTDFTLTAPVNVCLRRSVPCFVFSPFSANLMRHMLRVHENSPVELEDALTTSEVDEKTGLPKLLISSRDFVCRINQTLPLATAVLLNSFRSLEVDAVAELSEHLAIPVKCIGPLLPEDFFVKLSDSIMQKTILDRAVAESQKIKQQVAPRDKVANYDNFNTETAIVNWLNSQPQQSVVYISFGSMVVLKAEQISEISRALLQLDTPCVWSLRATQHHFLPAELQKPNQTLLILPWVPQKTVLKHPATGVFVTHCGWNSTLEGVSSAVPMVCWPMKDDQHLNARTVIEKGFGILIPKTELSGSRIVEMKEFCDSVRQVFGERVEDGQSRYCQAAQTWACLAQAAVSGSSRADFSDLFLHGNR